MKLAIGVCSARDWKPQFGESLVESVAYILHNGVNGEPLEDFCLIKRTQVSHLPRGRHSVLMEAIARDFTHLFMVDDDMVFPFDTIERLATHGKDCVGVNYSHKTPESTGMVLGMDKQFSTRSSGLEQVLRMGGGVMLLDLTIPRQMKPPFFEMRWIPERQTIGGEDYYFCDRLTEAGAKLWCDHDIKVGHIGDCEYRL